MWLIIHVKIFQVCSLCCLIEQHNFTTIETFTNYSIHFLFIFSLISHHTIFNIDGGFLEVWILYMEISGNNFVWIKLWNILSMTSHLIKCLEKDWITFCCSVILQAICDNAQGLVNFILFCILQSRLWSVLIGRLGGCGCCQSLRQCESHDHDIEQTSRELSDSTIMSSGEWYQTSVNTPL